MIELQFSHYYQAIDDSVQEKAEKKAQMIEGVEGDYGIKLNLDLISKAPQIIRQVADITGRPVFADLKMNNGKRTMNELVKMVGDQGAVMVNAYVNADRLLEKAIQTAKSYGMIFLGVTVTTHFDEDYCKEYYRRTLAETVKFLAQKAMDLGCNGYILPGTMLNDVDGIGGIKFNPAMRPEWYEDKKTNDQEQIVTPGQAILNGGDIVSCGSPVFKSPDPREALRRILDEVEEAWKQRSSSANKAK